jgi:hypothetical protein
MCSLTPAIAGEVMCSLVAIYPAVPAKIDSFERLHNSFEKKYFH